MRAPHLTVLEILSSMSLAAFLLPLLVSASNVTLYHRVYAPDIPQVSYVERGVVDSSLFQPSSSLSQQWLDFEQALADLKFHPHIDLDRVLYQVALEREDAEWEFSSVKLVWSRVPQNASETKMFLVSVSPSIHKHRIHYSPLLSSLVSLWN